MIPLVIVGCLLIAAGHHLFRQPPGPPGIIGDTINPFALIRANPKKSPATTRIRRAQRHLKELRACL